ncbi:bifunctional 3-deoxy-7-phosphoheptulonate synthase/chorismate mutase type II [Elizabethkingia meningoseptica]|uniref:chorismate mutase n=2 Tax=Elizabethkingia meningoseptica TaxID=238 RepID=A0A1V3U0V1_ELIME|nr:MULTISPECIES: chorismate mutase [Elizabethkingia]AQX06054.1 3-deoxy-7-phosphoheptulonate synthase [Elizabethkingia meningoseptica]AQX13595.1 3-deoxy-7-phosphoheptulonate synthase [Elizabethkingia meningoseptica]AQX48100.1 3-deoxy-7-phosphoheptulonate synthase [Elizabethkingia meningoseptica]EJK5327512.1 bifunctional 3-deoxy-7-phosphoheptulonate synthase/chorismate mutase type II [Elizabethkingia meningoseptica]EOR31028.1 2-keto-3-deoxy-D-arabino-heptulosonate-7- phosphate synthase I beta [E
MNLNEVKSDWISELGSPLVIAGPCSAESESQMLEAARRIKESNANVPIFRAGIWKPRTKPNGFEGVGVIGLNWLKKVKEEYGFKTATEVANANHVFAALEADVDILWIGARSTVNPFTVQEIAQALRGTNKPVLVKNPVNPDLALWIGAMERLLGQDVKNLGVIHRGFSNYQKTKYRNVPNWTIALDFKKQFPNIPMVVDPSHICGNRTGLASIAQEALNCGYEGLMIETHPNPDEAWSDAAQQITPEVLADLLANLKTRNQDISGYEDEMGKHRTLISDIDFQLIGLLSQRMKVSEKIGTLKKENNIAIFQPDRWKVIAEYAAQKADETGMSREFIEKVFNAIHEESIDVQNNIMINK